MTPSIILLYFQLVFFNIFVSCEAFIIIYLVGVYLYFVLFVLLFFVNFKFC